MLDKYQDRFAALTQDEAYAVAEAISSVYEGEPHEGVTGEDVYSWCQELELDQGAVVMTMARRTDVPAMRATERLIGQPIHRHVPAALTRMPGETRTPPAKKQRPKGNAVQRRDPRVIVHVMDNPKRPGSAAHERFALYQQGMTVTEALAAGVRSVDITHDTKRGFITLGEPQS